MSRTFSGATTAFGRSCRAERTLTFLVGVLALLLGVLTLLVSFGLLGSHRAQRPVLDPVAVNWLSRQPATAVTIVVIVAGIAVLVLGLWWFLRSLRPEGRPDLELDRTRGRELTVTAGAITAAVRADAASLSGLSKARVRVVGENAHPALRLTLWLREGTDVREVWDELDRQVLARARTSLGLEVLPTAVRIELDARDRTRVR